MEDYGERIANAGLDIGAIKLSPGKPFQWASGFWMPIYNDNRMLLGTYEHRKLVAEALRDLLPKDARYDMIGGTSTSGIAPATSLANLLGFPVVILDQEKPYVFENLGQRADEILAQTDGESFDAIASTCPFSIPFGVSVANEMELPFMYVRQSKKSHGLMQQIEGISREGQNVLLLDYFIGAGNSYVDAAVSALEAKNLKIAKIISEEASGRVKQRSIAGARLPVIEDLISTGGSSVSEVRLFRKADAQVDTCVSIFNYCLSEATILFENANCRVNSALTYPRLLKKAEQQEYVNGSNVEVLQEWRAAPFDWGKNHGFPPGKADKKVYKLTEKEEAARKRVCLVVDVTETRKGMDVISELADLVGMFKIGKATHSAACNEGARIIRMVYEMSPDGSPNVFLDLKIHDTPDQQYLATSANVIPGVYMLNLHISGGENMCRKAVEAATLGAKINNIPRPKVIGVTELTSLNDADLEVQGLGIKYQDLVMRRTELALKWGLDGIVCPANLAGEVEKRFGRDLLKVTPGVEWKGKQGEGQKQVYTPDAAVRDCKNSILVIGSAITKTADRRETTYEILKAMAQYL